jgi:hypothetical protein
MAKVYKTRIKKSAVKSMSQKPLRDRAYKIVKQRIEEAKQKTLAIFEKHPVTSELESGPRGQNISGTLGGYGNLFSYIGFSSGANPIDPLRVYLNRKPRVYRNSKFVKKSNSAEFVFIIEIPSLSEMEELAQSPFEGRSWLRGLERGISGLGYYLHSKTGQLAGSRSGFGLQTENRLRAMTFKPITYMTNILKEFRREANLG